jgi:hypothetical protein
MTDAISVRLDAAFVLAVTGAALIVPWGALVVGAAFLVGNAVWAWRSAPKVAE